jgi:hypothetical protein
MSAMGLEPDNLAQGPDAGGLARSLHGRLPCVTCRYNLQGLSVLGVCPECGTAVRATVLAAVDPLAGELRPIGRPRAVALGTLLWTGGAMVSLVAALVGHGWWLTLGLVGALQSGRTPLWADAMVWVASLALVLAGVGALMISRPHGGVPLRTTALALVGGVLLMLAGWWVHGSWQSSFRWNSAMAGAPTWLAATWLPEPDRVLRRLVAGVLMLGSIACLRPIARVLVARCLTIRTGRVDRQTMLGTAASIGVVMLGDALTSFGLSRTGGAGPLLQMIGLSLLGIGLILLVLALVGSLVDGVRIARAIARPGPSMAQVFGEPGGGERGGAPLEGHL